MKIINAAFAGMAAIAVLGTATVVPVSAFAAATPAQSGPCHLYGMAFSPGSVARVGTMPKICAPDSSWQDTSQQTAGCIYDSKIYATGALKALGDAADTKLECLADGTWSPVPKPQSKAQ